MSKNRYHPISVALHWTIFLLIVVAFASIEIRGYLPSGNQARPLLRSTHVLVGQLIFVLAVLRVAARFGLGAPPALGNRRWQTWAVHGGHIFLYGALLLQPLMGLLFMQTGGRDVALLGWTLPTLIAPDVELESNLKDAHKLFGTAIYFLIAGHVLAAYWHQYVLKEECLSRMAISRGKRG